MFDDMGNDGWKELGTTKGGKIEMIDHTRINERISNRSSSVNKVQPVENFFDSLTNQWCPYDTILIMANTITPGQEQESARSDINEKAQDIIKIQADCTSRHWSGAEVHVVTRFLGVGGVYMYTPAFKMEDAGEMEVIVDSIVNDMPVLYPGVTVRPAERAMALFGSGSKDLLFPLAQQVKTGLQPIRWCSCLGGDMNASSAAAFFIVSMNGAELQKLFGKAHPPSSVLRWRKRTEELLERAIRAK